MCFVEVAQVLMCHLKLYKRWQQKKKTNQPDVVAKWAFVKDVSEHIIVSLIAVHSQKILYTCWAPWGTPVSGRDSSLTRLKTPSQKGHVFQMLVSVSPGCCSSLQTPKHQRESWQIGAKTRSVALSSMGMQTAGGLPALSTRWDKGDCTKPKQEWKSSFLHCIPQTVIWGLDHRV